MLEATKTPKTFNDTFGDISRKRELREDFEKCYYWITAPNGKRIEIKLLRFSPARIAVDGCKYGGVEIKTQEDQRLTGYRFCSEDVINTALVSRLSLVPIITYSRASYTEIVLQYRFL